MTSDLNNVEDTFLITEHIQDILREENFDYDRATPLMPSMVRIVAWPAENGEPNGTSVLSLDIGDSGLALTGIEAVTEVADEAVPTGGTVLIGRATNDDATVETRSLVVRAALASFRANARL